MIEVLDRALEDGPQTITRHGKRAVVVVSAEEWDRKNARQSIAGAGAQPARSRDRWSARLYGALRGAFTAQQRRGDAIHSTGGGSAVNNASRILPQSLTHR